MSQRMVYQTEETRQKILAAAQAMFIEKGFFDTQMKDVAAAVGISRNSLYRYFHDKGDLGYAVLELVYTRIEPGLDKILREAQANTGMNGRERLRLFLEKGLLNKGLRTDLTFMAEFDTYFSGNRIPANFRSQASRQLPVATISNIGALIIAGVEDGSIRQDIAPEQLLPMVLYSTKALQQHVLLRGQALLDLSRRDTERLLPNLITVLIDGLKPVQPE
ncbi:MAG: TetR/AcrR family transcriptional regulator [Haliea sp.]|uniref:TetR/AcrR family transcriptional regulator n=1 Tax=Haliea sp. TaxID=1932666 RepID=UPI0032EFB1B9